MAHQKQKQAIGYVRVSTEDQASDGVSLDAQRHRVKAYCEANGLELVRFCSDDGLSAKRADNRPGLQRAITEACRRKAVVVVYSLSRLARSTRDAIDISERLNGCGADLASISEKIDTTSAMGQFFFTTIAALAQLERDQVSERTKAAMAYKRSENQRISRHIPFGYTLGEDGRTLVENEDEQAAIALILEWHGEGASLRRIAERLNTARFKTKNGGPWQASSVRGILRRAEREG